MKNIPSIIKSLFIIWLIGTVIVLALFINNGQYNDAIKIGVFELVLILGLFVLIRSFVKKDPLFFKQTVEVIRFSSSIILFMFILFLFASSIYTKRTYTIGKIQVTFPKEHGFIYSKDNNSVQYYFDHCSINIKKMNNKSNYSIMEIIKDNENLEQKITDEIKVEDIYNSEFIEGKETINGKEWVSNYTQVGNVKYTLYYRIYNDDIYQISTENYNDNPKVCTDKFEETFKTIKYLE